LKAIIGLIGFLMKRKGEIAKMKHLETQEITSGIYVIKTKNANFYIIENGGDYIAIDTSDDEDLAKGELEQLGIDPEKITTVLLTHTDFDHIAALSLFKNADIYLAKEEVQMIDGTAARMFGFKSKLNISYKAVEDGEEIHFGKRKVKTILTPGHTKGSMSFVIDDEYLFVGDALSLQNGKAELFNSLFNMDDDAQKQSIEKLAKLQGISYIFTSHYGFSDDFGKAFSS